MKFTEMPYKRVELEEVQKAFAQLESDFDKAATGEEQFAVHQRFYQLSGHVMTQATLAEIRHDIDMTDEFYAGEQTYYDGFLPQYQNMLVSYQKKLMNSKFRPFLESRIGKVAFKNMELAANSVSEKILPLMTEESKLQNEYNQLLASARIPWKGEELNLSLMSPYLHNVQREVRAESWKLYSAFFADNREQLDDIYDKLVRNRTEQAKQMGYDSYLPLGYNRLNRNCYGRSDIAQFRKQIREDLVPFASQIHEARRSRLGIRELRYYDEDVYFTNGNPQPFGTPEQILNAGRKMYRELSKETGEFMDFMCENELFDVLGRKSKKTGGYMTYLHDHNSPFVFANFNGTAGDVDVITHECGHAFQGYLAGMDPIREHADITMETAETHSMSMEFFTEPWMNLFFGERAADYKRMHLESSILFIPYGTMVDEFQDIIYSDPSLSPKQRNQVWHDLERQYKPHLNYEGNTYYEEGGFWQNKHHIYDCPLYYIDYCIAGVNALQYRAMMEKDYRAAWESYLKLCKLSASDFFDGLVDQVGLNNPFEDGCVRFTLDTLRACLERME